MNLFISEPGTGNRRFGQFTCTTEAPMMAMVEITGRCNMSCPLCFADAGPHAVDVGYEAVVQSLRRLKHTTGIVPLQISGGEPTLHPRLEAIIASARELGFGNIELVTNGLVLQQRPGFLEGLAKRGLSAVYLQFDGLRASTHTAIRGRDMRTVRTAALDAIRRSKLCCTLAVPVVRGVNDGEIGDIVRFAVANIDTVRAVNFQAATGFTGRFDVCGQTSRYTLQQLLEVIEKQAQLPAGSFRTDLLGHPSCNGMALVYPHGDRLESLFHHVTPATIHRFLGSNRRKVILDLFLGKERFIYRHLMRPVFWRALREAAPIFGRRASPGTIFAKRHLLLFAKSFMERDRLEPERIARCCYSIVDRSGVYSFCVYNNCYRFNSRTSIA